MSELVSTHADLYDPESSEENKMVLWQVNELKSETDSQSQLKRYHMTKVRDFYDDEISEDDGGKITHTVSPCGTTVATLSTNEQM